VITVRYWAAAREAAGTREERLEAASMEELRALLAGRPALDRVCSASSYLVDGAQAAPGALLPDGAVVDVLPPFAGG
jgi:sulfur-carrier protein